MNKCSPLNNSEILIFFFYLFFIAPVFGNGTWVGGATGFWDDGANWDDGIKPNNLDFVFIPAGVTVTVRNAGEVAEAVLLQDGGILNIMSGSLTIDGSSGLIFIVDGMLTIASGANLNISNTFDPFGDPADGITVGGGLATINNSGTITIGPDIRGAGIFVSTDGSLDLTNQIGGLITNSSPIDSHFLIIENSGSSARISNLGTIRVDMGGVGEDFFNINGSDVKVVNQASGNIIVDDVEDDAFNIDNGATLDNFGTITLTSTEDQAFDISEPGGATNHTTGVINIIGVRDEEAIDVTGTFVNDGIINISGVELDVPGNTAINIEDMGVFTNNNLINVGLGANRETIIKVENNATLNNLGCAVINITTEDPIVNEGEINNTGIITTVFTGTNTNSGTFNNSGIISTPTGVFTVNPNALIGSMDITTSPIPAVPILITGRDSALCSGQTIILSNLLNGAPQNTLEYGTSYGTYGLLSSQTPLVTTTYFVRDSNQTTRCVDTAKIVITINDQPLITGRDSALCSGQSVALNNLLTGTSQNTLEYGTSYGTYGLLSSQTPLVTTTYFVRDSNQTTRCVDTAKIVITINDQPLITGRDSALCSGQSVVLSNLLNGAPQNTLEYGTSYGAYGLLSSQTPLVTTTYFVRDSNQTTRCVDTAKIVITINDQPLITGRDSALCSGQSVVLSNLLNGAPQNTLEYGTSYGTYGLLSSQTPLATTTYFVRDSNQTTKCVDTAKIVITINDQPLITGRDSALCSEQTITLSNLLTGTLQNTLEYGTSYGTYGLLSSQTPLATTTYFVRDSNQTTRCIDTAKITITIEELPFITARDTSVMFGESVDLSSLLNQNVTGILDYGTTFGIYDITNPVTATATMPFFIRDSVQNAVGCVDTAQVMISIPTPIVSKDITDPCSCYDPENVVFSDKGNSNVTFYHDFITISNGGIGQTWQLQMVNSGQVLRKDGTPYPIGQTMSDLGGGTYRIDLWHRPDIGFNATFQRIGDGATLTSESTCSSTNCLVIPTMSQWGLLIFGLLILNISIFFVQRIYLYHRLDDAIAND